MNKSEVLVVGIGQCGGVLADEMKHKNKRYTTIYINSSYGDTTLLDYADEELNNIFIYSGADGSGRNRDKAKRYIENDKARLANFLKKYSNFKVVLVFASLDGGTGSGSICTFVRTIKSLYPDMKINIVGVLPKLSEQNLQLKNTLECCSEISENSHLINDIKFINNNKREDSSYSEINKCAINDIDMEYGMIGHSEEGSIDEDNLENVCTSQGYGVILNLPSAYDNLDEAIEKAKDRSVFSIPSSLECIYGAVNVISDDFKLDDIVSNLNAEQTVYKTYNDDKYNLICLGGCDIPTDDIEYIKLELEDRKEKSKPRSRKGFDFKYESEDKPKTESNKKSKRKLLDDDDIDALLDFENFRR